jgi:hypothetical protein
MGDIISPVWVMGPKANWNTIKRLKIEARHRCWVILTRKGHLARWRYWVSNQDPADLDESVAVSKIAKYFKPFTYSALRAELAGQGITAIPEPQYFLPTVEEQEEQVEALFRHIAG